MIGLFEDFDVVASVAHHTQTGTSMIRPNEVGHVQVGTSTAVAGMYGTPF